MAAALLCHRLRRSLQRSLSTIPKTTTTTTTTTLRKIRPLSSSLILQQTPVSSTFQSRGFRSSSITLSQSRQYKPYKDGDVIDADTVLFEGCDYNHWLITVDFPKDQPKPSPEEMVRTYEQICAKGLNISIEEAKMKIYACSTTTYEGFQAVMTEAESENFKDIPGVVFVLPDSYIDPQNKIYGGDKYENGVITPRPPPVQYGRGGGGRFRDRNRNPDQPRYDQQGSPMPRQGNPQYDQQGTRQGDGRNFGPPQNYPSQQNHGPQQNYPSQQNHGPPQNYPSQQNYGSRQNYPSQQNYGPSQNYPPQQNYGQPPMNNRDYAPGGRDTYQADRRGPMPSHQGNYNQGQHPQEGRGFPQDRSDYAHPGQREFRGDNRNYAPSYGQSFPGQGEGQSFSQVEQRNMEGDQRNYAPMGQTGTNQGRF